jgi:hypothetical protein
MIGAILHLADVLDLRLQFSEMDAIWKVWIAYLLIFDFVASIFLWLSSIIGVILFLIVASSQLIAYTFYKNIFGGQGTLIIFHLVTVSIYFVLLVRKIETPKSKGET